LRSKGCHRKLVVFEMTKERTMTTRVNLDRWRTHVTAAQEQGVTLARYAREHGLSRHTLYVARKQLQSEGGGVAKRQRRRRRKAARSSAFVAVQLAAAAPLLRVRLPNGVALELSALDTSACAALLGLLVALPCSN
jgi:transposase-like protein